MSGEGEEGEEGGVYILYLMNELMNVVILEDCE